MDHRQVLEAARNLARAMGLGVWVAPQLFGIPDVESLAWVAPEAI